MDTLYTDSHPEQLLDQRIEAFMASGENKSCFAVGCTVEQYYLSEQTALAVILMIELSREGGGCHSRVAVAAAESLALETVKEMLSVDALAAQYQLPVFNLGGPLLLSPVSIPKPWGQEVWYTGIESRGISSFTDGRHSTPISWLLELFPRRLANGQPRNLNLLKILDPLPQEVYGDLYFELHEQKQEVYVVTHIDEEAWPSGKGAIRFGFDGAKRLEFDSDDAFRLAFEVSVKSYESVRREIDALLDQQRIAQGIDLNAPVAAGQLQAWEQHLPAELIDRERELRGEMNAFTALRTLEVGDVVIVPTLTPHALQHGVRCVEFQTPVYERKILSFAQKVLTQSSWDTDDAIALMELKTPEQLPLKVLSQQGNSRLEEVVRFDDFVVKRLTLESGDEWQLNDSAGYQLVMSVNGGLKLDDLLLCSEQSALMPKSDRLISAKAMGKQASIVLIAEPI